jgi:hypothetical protein
MISPSAIPDIAATKRYGLEVFLVSTISQKWEFVKEFDRGNGGLFQLLLVGELNVKKKKRPCPLWGCHV